MQISPRKTNKDDVSNIDPPIVYKYQSKRGGSSGLIFNPTVALLITGNKFYDEQSATFENTILVPIHLIYQVAHTIEKVYNQLSDKNLFVKNNGHLLMDEKLATEKSRRISLFKTSLVVSPCIINDDFIDSEIGVSLFNSDSNHVIGALTHLEAMSLIEMIEHIDITTYSLLSAMADQLATLDAKLDNIDLKLERMSKMLQDIHIHSIQS